MGPPVQEQFRKFVAPHLQALFRVAYRLLRNIPDAQDLVQASRVEFTRPRAGRRPVRITDKSLSVADGDAELTYLIATTRRQTEEGNAVGNFLDTYRP